MKRTSIVMLLSAISFLMTGCYTNKTVMVATYDDMRNEMARTREKLSSIGYNLTGQSINTENNLNVSAHTFSLDHGFSNLIENNYTIKETYSFAKEDGSWLHFDVSYKLKYHYDYDSSILCATNISIPQCEVSSPQNYNALCGPNSPIWNIPNPTSQTAIEIDTLSGDRTILATLAILSVITLFFAVFAPPI
ncbi:MAG: hypothetical protein IJ764_02930 [Bacteroidales bacterium]|nr:hypothetical protein [Bacteroidales bacterium]